MELSIQKYVKIVPGIVTRNGQLIVKDDVQESPEKSLIQTYRAMGINYLKFFKMDNLSKLAILAAEGILNDSGLYEKTDKNNVAVVLSNASSSLVTDTNYQKTISDPGNYFPSPSLFVYTLPNITIGEICIKHKIYGENIFLVSQKFDAGILYFYVNELFKSTVTQHCITGWVECNETTYEAFLLLIEKGTNGLTFNTAIIDKLYITKHKL